MSTFSTSSRQQRLKTLSFLHFWLRNVLRATTACTFSKLDIPASKSGPNMVCFVHFHLEMCFAPQRRALFRNSTSQPPKVVRTWCVLYIFTSKCASRHNGATSQLPKVVRTWCVLYIFTWKCASRHNGVHFLDISTSKSGPNLVCFIHFDLQMCFAPQRRALFRHLNFQKWSDIGVFCTFWLGNVLRATTACTFSSLIWPAGSAPAALASLLFDPPEPQIIGKTQWIATFLPFRASASSFFWSFLFWLFSPLLFNCPYCRKFHF